jgi:hypothetical protein
MISLKKIIVEGRYDSLVTGLSRKLLEVTKQSYSAVKNPDGKFAGEKIYYESDAPDINSDDCPHIFFEEIENTDIPLEFYLQLKVLWIKGFGAMNTNGNAYNETTRNAADPPLIEVLLQLDPEYYPNILSEVSYEFRDILRHEIEHLTQSGWNTIDDKYIASDQAMRRKIESGKLPAYRYWLLQKEIPAMIQGLYNKAKKSRTPFADVVNDYLQHIITKGWVTPEQSETIKDTWRTYLPKLAIRQEL